MAESLKVLGQANPAADILTPLYTVPVSTSVTASTLQICNRTSSTISVSVSVAVEGASDSLEQYLLYDTKVEKNSFLTLTIGITLSAMDVVRVRTDTLGASFNLFGVELT